MIKVKSETAEPFEYTIPESKKNRARTRFRMLEKEEENVFGVRGCTGAAQEPKTGTVPRARVPSTGPVSDATPEHYV